MVRLETHNNQQPSNNKHKLCAQTTPRCYSIDPLDLLYHVMSVCFAYAYANLCANGSARRESEDLHHFYLALSSRMRRYHIYFLGIGHADRRSRSEMDLASRDLHLAIGIFGGSRWYVIIFGGSHWYVIGSWAPRRRGAHSLLEASTCMLLLTWVSV